jgi:ATP-binding cassette subfamily F protein 3
MREASGKACALSTGVEQAEVLSGGEKTRLNRIKFLVDPPNLLHMDEPTTHLDIHTVESLILALAGYEGTLVFIRHDVHFIRKLATKTLHVHAGQVSPYPGGYDYFLEKPVPSATNARR